MARWMFALSTTISLALLEECNPDASNIVTAYGTIETKGIASSLLSDVTIVCSQPHPRG